MANFRGMRRPRATPAQTYTEWRWPPSTSFARTLLAGYKSFEHVLLPEVDPGPDTHYFWAHQFRMIGGEGGYIGLQTKGDRADGGTGKVAIFSIWDAEEAEGRRVPWATAWPTSSPSCRCARQIEPAT